MSQRRIIGVFDIGARRKSAGDPCDLDACGADSTLEVHRGGLAVKVRIGSDDNFADALVLEALEKLFDLEIGGGDAACRRDGAVQHVIHASVGARPLNGRNVKRFLNYADDGSVAVRVGADSAHVFFRDVGASFTQLDSLLDAGYGFGEFERFGFGHPNEMVRETLSAFRSDAWKSAERFDDPCDRCGHTTWRVSTRSYRCDGTRRIRSERGHRLCRSEHSSDSETEAGDV